jgi:DNA-binding response OmpR family regulator
MVRRKTVLVVDDVDAVRRLIRDVLAPQGYEVLEAASGAAALWVLENYEGPLDLIVTDLDMPGMHGVDLAALAGKRRRRIPVLFMSGHGDRVLGHFGLRRQDPNFVPKPFHPEDLVRRVRELTRCGPECEERRAPAPV